VWGEPTKNGKENFGFASPLQSPKRALLFYHILIALFSALTATEAQYKAVCARAQSYLICACPARPVRAQHPRRFEEKL